MFFSIFRKLFEYMEILNSNAHPIASIHSSLVIVYPSSIDARGISKVLDRKKVDDLNNYKFWKAKTLEMLELWIYNDIDCLVVQ